MKAMKILAWCMVMAGCSALANPKDGKPQTHDGTGAERKSMMRIDYYVMTQWEQLKHKEYDAAVKALDVAIYFQPLNPDARGHLKLAGNFEKALVNLRKKMKPGAKVWLGVGNMDPIYKNQAALDKMVGELKALCRKYDFVGIDVDWEHMHIDPGEFAHVIKCIYEMAHPAGIKVSISHDQQPSFIAPSKAAEPYFDYLLLQLYQGDELDGMKKHLARNLKAGIPMHKICVGLGILGRNFGVKRGDKHAYPYVEILANGGSPDERLWTNPKNQMVFPHNTRALIKEKTEYARKAGLAGVFTWHILLDAPYSSPNSLVRIIDQTMGKTP